MNEVTGSGSDRDTAGEAARPKQVEKVKSDEEKLPEKFKIEGEKFQKEIEKVKSDWEKYPVKEHKSEKLEKPEKEKVEQKEGKLEIKEKIEYKAEGKPEIKEHKPEKEKLEIKEHKPEKLEFEKAAKIEVEKSPVPEKGMKEGEVPGPPEGPVSPLDRDTLIRHAEALENMGRQLRHFIEQSDRPDLSRGALHDEPDQQEESEGDG
jgi:hypothetical protein